MKRLILDLDDLRERYLEGISEKRLAERYGVSRTVIALRLRELGIARRDRSAAMGVRMEIAGPDERKRLVEAAHAAVRGRARSEGDLARRARGRRETDYFVSVYEDVLDGWLRARGIVAERQTPVGRYNLDFSVGTVAVELHRRSDNPARTTGTRKRAYYLLDRGWSVLYVWARSDGPLALAENAADEVVSFLNVCESLPPGAREYRVIRGSGEPSSSFRYDTDEAATIGAPVAHSRVPNARY